MTNHEDATALRRTAHLLQESDEAIFWEADASAAHFSFVSESARAVLGYSPQEWRTEPGFLQKHVHPDDWSRLLQTFYEAAADSMLHKCEHRMLRADGSTLWAQTSVRPSESTTGPTQLTCVTVDVTHVKGIEDRIRHEQSLCSLAIDNVRGCAVFLLSSKGTVETWSAEARRVTGYSREQMVGAEIARLFPATGDAQPAAKLLRRVQQHDSEAFEGWLVREDGTQFWATLVVTAAADPATGLHCYAVALTDLTARHELEVGLRNTVDNLQFLFRNVHEHGVWMTSTGGVVESWSPGGQRLTGYRSHEIVGSHIATLLPPEELAKGTLDRLLEEAERAGSSAYDGWVVRKSGERFWGSVLFGAAEDESGHLRGFATVVRDLTERKRREDALRANEEHFRLLVDSVQDYAICMLSVDGCVATWNRGAQRLTGHRSHEILHAHLSRFFPEAEVQKDAPGKLLETAASEGHASYEGWLVRRNGETFWGMIHLDAIEDEDGRLRGFSKVARDLTSQKRVEAALRESEERLRLLVDSVQDYAVFMISPQGTVATWNRGAERLHGYGATEIIGAPLSRFFPPEVLALGTLDSLMASASRDGGRVEYEGWLVRNDGRRIWGNIMLSAVRDADGHLRGYSIIARNLTERMRNERAQTFLAEAGQALAVSLDYRTTLEKVAQLAIRELADCCIVAVDAGATITPVVVAHVDDAKRRKLEETLAALPADAPILQGMTHTMRTGESQLHPDSAQADWFRAAVAEGSPIICDLQVRSCMCAPMVVGGRPFGAVCFLSSTPARRYDEIDLRLAEELARRAALAIENARLYEEAQHAIRTREEVLAIVSHDLRSPLSTIVLGAEQLSKEGVPGHPRVTATLATIARSAKRMTRMISDLLDFSSIEAGRLTLEPRDCDAHDLIRDVVEMYGPIAAEKSVILVDETKTAEVQLHCDPNRIVQVLSNLTGNAIKFTPPHETVKLEAVPSSDGRTVTFIVTDHGPGIAQADVPHVFDRYWQAKRRAGQGVGLGLAISKGLVEAHGGSIHVATRPGEGCVFSFTLPTAEVRDAAG